MSKEVEILIMLVLSVGALFGWSLAYFVVIEPALRALGGMIVGRKLGRRFWRRRYEQKRGLWFIEEADSTVGERMTVMFMGVGASLVLGIGIAAFMIGVPVGLWMIGFFQAG